MSSILEVSIIRKGECMKQLITLILLVIGVTGSLQGFAFAADCPAGEWNVLPNYVPGHGTPCQLLGLDTHRGTCQGKNQFETLCDDASGGRYKICQGPRRCERKTRLGPPPNIDCRQWDFTNNSYCPPGYENSDCNGTCGKRVLPPPPAPPAPPQPSPPRQNCQNWDYDHNRPCPSGYINRDCHGGCGPR